MINRKITTNFEIFNICNQVSYSVKDIVKNIESIKKKIIIKIDPKKEK